VRTRKDGASLDSREVEKTRIRTLLQTSVVVGDPSRGRKEQASFVGGDVEGNSGKKRGKELQKGKLAALINGLTSCREQLGKARELAKATKQWNESRKRVRNVGRRSQGNVGNLQKE